MEPLKRFLAAGLALIGLSAFAANPDYGAFKGTNGLVVTTPGVGAARVVVMSGELFQPGSTNLTNWANLPTNVVSGANIWTQSGGTAFPTSAGAVIATNVQSWDKLISKGAFIAETRSRTLTAGTNTLAVLTNSYLLLDSPTNDAASVVVQIGAAASLGQLLFVVNNQTNRAFTIYDGSASGSGIVELQGNFVSTNLGGLILMNQGNWVEVGRFSPAGLTTSATINPTDNFLPYRQNATTFGDSPWYVVQGTNAAFDSKIIFGPGTTNALWKDGSESITYSNGATAVFLKMKNVNGLTSQFGTSAGGHANVLADTARNVYLGANNNASGDLFLWTNGITGIVFQPVRSNMVTLGSPAEPFKSLYLQTNSLYFGTNVYTDGGSSLLRNGVAVGASSGPDLVWTNSAGVIQPNGLGANTNAIRISPIGGVVVGTNADITLAAQGYSFVAAADGAAAGQPNKTGFWMDFNSGATTLSHSVLINSDTGPSLRLEGTNDVITFFAGDWSNTELGMRFTEGGNDVTTMLPNMPNSATALPYIFDTVNGLFTAGSLLASFRNKTIAHLNVNPTNGISTPAITAYGAVSKAWQFGAGSNNVDVLLRATNMAEITIEGIGAVFIPYARK